LRLSALQRAQDRGINASAYDVATSDTAGASFHGRNTPGTSRLVVDEDRSVIVGATFTGTEVAEWLQAATIAHLLRVRRREERRRAARARAGRKRRLRQAVRP
jgi:pyruvate/2-oxoglutarate dehydrogenase complex dihydrolipoamide dehydrogenase (E3) component